MVDLKLQTNEKRCAFTSHEHKLYFADFCPVSGNPHPGSSLTISYKGRDTFLEVVSLRAFIDSYMGGRGDVRSMEGMLQEIAQCCANVLRVDVKVTSDLVLEPKQLMRVTCLAFPSHETLPAL